MNRHLFLAMAVCGIVLLALGGAGRSAQATPAAPSQGPHTVLYDQYDNIGANYTNSQQYEPAMLPYNDFSADDFVVPAGQTWTISEVDVQGYLLLLQGPLHGFNVSLYDNAGSLPGHEVYTATNLLFTTPGQNQYVIALPSPAVVGPGTYWLMVQGILGWFTNEGQWSWYNRAAQSGYPAAWTNPGDGWGTMCHDVWGIRWGCQGDRPAPDQVFRLIGTTSAGPTPTPVPTNTPTPPGPINTPTPTPPGPINTPTPTPPGPINTPIPTPTHNPSATIPGPTVSATPCLIQFSDVPATHPFYTFVRCLACRGIVGGYPCGGSGEPCPGAYFRPNANVTRGQVSKIVAEAAQFRDPVPSTQQTFEDVASGSTFALWVERLSIHSILGGYPCGAAFEPCVSPTNRPYFRPNNQITRGQLSKIVGGAAGWTETPTGQTFEDVPPGSTFYLPIERIATRAIVSGYPCGGVGEPCLAPTNRPYYRPNANATRGQMSKITTSIFYPACQVVPGAKR